MNLAPEHVADLRASGLEDSTIPACGYEAVRPNDIKLQGVDSAYRITYFDLEGQYEWFRTSRSFFQQSNDAMVTLRNISKPPGSTPPLSTCRPCSSGSVAKDVRAPIYPEGEKKAAKSCQAGLHASEWRGVELAAEARQGRAT